jgi:hypothetical protein
LHPPRKNRAVSERHAFLLCVISKLAALTSCTDKRCDFARNMETRILGAKLGILHVGRAVWCGRSSVSRATGRAKLDEFTHENVRGCGILPQMTQMGADVGGSELSVLSAVKPLKPVSKPGASAPRLIRSAGVKSARRRGLLRQPNLTPGENRRGFVEGAQNSPPWVLRTFGSY